VDFGFSVNEAGFHGGI